MAGGRLTGLYSGIRGLDLGPTKMRNDEAFRRQQLREDMRRALSGEKIAASELALRSDAEKQKADTELKRRTLDETLARERMGLDRAKMEQEGRFAGENLQIEREKLGALGQQSIHPQVLKQKQSEAFSGLVRAGIPPAQIGFTDDGWPVWKAPVAQPKGTGEGATIDPTPEKTAGEKLGQSIWDFDKWMSDRFPKIWPKRGGDAGNVFPGSGERGDTPQPKQFEDLKKETEKMYRDFLAEKAKEAEAMTDVQLWRMIEDTEDIAVRGVLAQELTNRKRKGLPSR